MKRRSKGGSQLKNRKRDDVEHQRRTPPEPISNESEEKSAYWAHRQCEKNRFGDRGDSGLKIWVSIHNGGGVGIGYSLHAGQVTVADGSDEMTKRIERVLTTDPGMGIIRHADAGYEQAIQFAKETGVKVPMGPVSS